MFLVLSLAGVALSGCQTPGLTKPTFAASQDEAASVTVIATTPKPWSDVEASLAPNFTMTGDLAATKVLANTANIQEASLNAGGANFAVGFPQSSTAGSAVSTQTLGSNTVTTGGVATMTGNAGSTQTNTQTTTTGPGVVPTAPTTVPGGALAALAAPTAALGQDLILQYQEAYNANQYIQLKNQDLTGAVRRACFVPYLVTLKYTVDAKRLHMPYKIDLSGAFFRAEEPALPKPADPAAPAKPLDPCEKFTNADPVVVPILVTDDVQVETRSQAQQSALLLSAAASVMSHGVGGQLGGDWAQQRYRALQSEDLSSQVTISQPTNNSLSVAIAPNNEATDLPGQVRRAYDVYLVLEVPKPYFTGNPAMKYDAVADFQSVIDGTRLKPRSTAVMVGLFNDRIKTSAEQVGATSWLDGLNAGDSHRAVWNLVNLVITGDKASFAIAIKCPATWKPDAKDCGGAELPKPDFTSWESFKGRVWTVVVSLVPDLSTKSVLILPQAPGPISIPDQTATVLDDGKTASTVLLHDVVTSSITSMTALLDLVSSDGKGGTGKDLQLPSSAMKYDPIARSLTLTFPSPTVWGVVKLDETRSVLRFSVSGCDTTTTVCPSLNVGGPDAPSLKAILQVAAKPDAAADFKSAAEPTIMTEKDGVGSTTITLADLGSFKGESVAISATGARLVSVTDEKGNLITPAMGVYTATAQGLYVLNFQDLRPNGQVIVTLQGKLNGAKSGSASINLSVAPK